LDLQQCNAKVAMLFTSMWQAVSYYITLSAEALIGVFGVRVYEEPRYQVVGRVDCVEIRSYAPRVAAEVAWPVADSAGREQAFWLLFAYIAGSNQLSALGNVRVAMTAPVEVRGRDSVMTNDPIQTSGSDGIAKMRFFLPAKYNLDTAPKPLDARITLGAIPERTVAILRFAGSGHDFVERQSEMVGKLAGLHWQPKGRPYQLYYDPPFTLPFLRRNEAAVDVEARPDERSGRTQSD
jgi:SOUL heme-binding protein